MRHSPITRRSKHSLNLLIVLSGVVYPCLCLGLASDRAQILSLSADHAELSQETRQGIFTGHVIFNQGSTHIRASKAVTTTNRQNQLDAAIAYGSAEQPAHFWTQTALDKPSLHAYAREMRYYPEKHTIELRGNA